MAAVVLDASTILSALFPDEPGRISEIIALIGREGALVPPIWPAEVVNGVWLGIRRGRVDQDETITALERLNRLSITVVELELPDYAGKVLSLALRHGLSVYDASYLYLAWSRALPLVTRDRRLQTAAGSENVALA